LSLAQQARGVNARDPRDLREPVAAHGRNDGQVERRPDERRNDGTTPARKHRGGTTVDPAIYLGARAAIAPIPWPGTAPATMCAFIKAGNK